MHARSECCARRAQQARDLPVVGQEKRERENDLLRSTQPVNLLVLVLEVLGQLLYHILPPQRSFFPLFLVLPPLCLSVLLFFQQVKKLLVKRALQDSGKVRQSRRRSDYCTHRQ